MAANTMDFYIGRFVEGGANRLWFVGACSGQWSRPHEVSKMRYKFNSQISIGFTVEHNDSEGEDITLEDVRLALNDRCADIEYEIKHDMLSSTSIFEFISLEDTSENVQEE
jgi:hypothetical protein